MGFAQAPECNLEDKLEEPTAMSRHGRYLVPLLLGLALWLTGCARSQAPSVVVYCALDQIYSEPILRDFERHSGIRVLAKYDLEATKTSGLVNLLLLEKQSPRCDVFWNNEMLQTVVLQRAGVLEPYRSPSAQGIPERYVDPEGHWTGFAARLRVLIVHKELARPRPGSVRDLSDPRWKGRVGMARPLFGTTLTHWVALHQVLGAQEARKLLEQARQNEVAILDGNSVVRDRVAAGELAWGLTDSDDANGAILDGARVEMVLPDQDDLGTLVIPNTVALIRGGPNSQAGQRLIDYLLSVEVEERLARTRSLQIPLHTGARATPFTPDLARVRAMEVNVQAMADQFQPVVDQLREMFQR